MSKHEHEVEVKGLKPRHKGLIHNQSLPSAGTRWLSKDIHPKHTPSAIRITVSVTVPGVLSATITRNGDTQT